MFYDVPNTRSKTASIVFISIGFAICAFIPVAVYCCCVISIISAMPRVIKTLPNRQRISFHATGCHFTGPVALRRRLSSVLPQMFILFYHVMFFLVHSFLLYSKIYSKIFLHTSIHPHAPATSSSSAIVSLTAL